MTGEQQPSKKTRIDIHCVYDTRLSKTKAMRESLGVGLVFSDTSYTVCVILVRPYVYNEMTDLKISR